MVDAGVEGAGPRERLRLLLEQLGADLVLETLGVDAGELAQLQDGSLPLAGITLERLEALSDSMGSMVEWWNGGTRSRRRRRLRAWSCSNRGWRRRSCRRKA